MQLDLQVEGFLSRASRGAFVSGDRFKAFIHGLGYSSSPQVPTDPPGCRVGGQNLEMLPWKNIGIPWDFSGKHVVIFCHLALLRWCWWVEMVAKNGDVHMILCQLTRLLIENIWDLTTGWTRFISSFPSTWSRQSYNIYITNPLIYFSRFWIYHPLFYPKSFVAKSLSRTNNIFFSHTETVEFSIILSMLFKHVLPIFSWINHPNSLVPSDPEAILDALSNTMALPVDDSGQVPRRFPKFP